VRQGYRWGREWHRELRLRGLYKFLDSKHYYEGSKKQALTKRGDHTKRSLQSLPRKKAHAM